MLSSVCRSAARSWIAGRGLRAIATSGKKSDTAVVTPSAEPAVTARTKEESIVTDKNWMSYGFDANDRVEDENARNSVTFFVVTIVFVCGGYYLIYRPDCLLKDWSSREAFILLREREGAGLLPISPNYVDPSTVDLPDDDELTEVEIII